MSNILAEINAKEIKKLVRKDTIALLIFAKPLHLVHKISIVNQKPENLKE
ncbi:MAG: hypothetical protein ACE5J2_01640 [Nitrososphaerales archaeon]